MDSNYLLSYYSSCFTYKAESVYDTLSEARRKKPEQQLAPQLSRN